MLAAGSVIEHGLPENLYREPHNVGTMALVGFPPANFLRGSLQRCDGAIWCGPRSLHSRRIVPSTTASTEVIVGFRPERIRLSLWE